jgi:hypothetical protein
MRISVYNFVIPVLKVEGVRYGSKEENLWKRNIFYFSYFERQNSPEDDKGRTENCAARSGNSLPTFRTEISVSNYHYSLRNNPKSAFLKQTKLFIHFSR